MELLNTKSMLAKLMATENLAIEQRNVSTASFDVKNRVLTVPVLNKNISSQLYDLFMGHEVGHALYTPLEGMIRVREEKINSSIVNVVEDSRIERKIKNKYPGLRNSFIKAYSELIDRNFFETKGRDINNMNFGDRLNMHCKGGAQLAIEFTEKERELLDAVESTENFDQVIEVSKRIIEYMKLEKIEKENSPKPKNSDEMLDDDFESDDYLENEGYGDENEDSDIEDEEFENSDRRNEGDTNEEDSDGLDDTSQKSDVSLESEQGNNEDITIKTDEAYRRNENKLFEDNAKNSIYFNIPKVNGNEMIWDYKTVYQLIKKDIDNYCRLYHSLDNVAAYRAVDEYAKFRNDNSKIISYLVKEFELRKNADQLKRSSIAKTGELNMNKIFSYKFSEDIFKRMNMVPDGKSHGLVMFIDWSGSMIDHINNTLKQVLVLSLFCKKVNIPFEVYAFSDRDAAPGTKFFKKGFVPKEGDLVLEGLTLLNLFSSRMSASEFKYAAETMMYFTIGKGYNSPSTWLKLNGTPLNECIIASSEIINEFRKKYKLQIVNAIFLTDGESNSNTERYENVVIDVTTKQTAFRGVNYRHFNREYNRIVWRDSVTKEEKVFDSIHAFQDMTSALIGFLKSRTGCNILGFYILNSRTLKTELSKFVPQSNVIEIEKHREEFRKNKCTIVTSAGYDEYYLLNSESMNEHGTNETFQVADNVTVKGMVSAFAKYSKNRIASRTVLNRFIGMIA